MRKYIVFLISLSLCLLVGSSIYKVYAMEGVNDCYLVSSYTTTTIERDIQFNQELEEINSESLLRGPEYKYKTVYLKKQYKTVSGYIGNQPPGGTRLSGGGYIYCSYDGGPSVSTSIGLALPWPFDKVSLYLNLGQVSSSAGFSVSLPNTYNYFKIYVDKTFEIRPYATYRARVGTNKWELFNSGAVSVFFRQNAYAKKVG